MLKENETPEQNRVGLTVQREARCTNDLLSEVSEVTDYERVKAMLTEFGVEFTEHKSVKGDLTFLQCKSGSEKVGGYSGFYTDFDFDKDGKFLGMGAWE